MTMEENNKKTSVEYIATIIAGDKYHECGEEFKVSSYDLEGVKMNGLRIEIKDENLRDDMSFFHFYPVSIRKITYHMVPVSIETVEGGGRENRPKWADLIGRESYSYDDPNEWMNRWP